jgi:site-specific recombinase XerD
MCSRIILDGDSKAIVRKYVKYIRPFAPNKPTGDYLFFNSEGTPLNSSTFSTALEKLQEHSVYSGVRSRDLRKHVSTLLRDDAMHDQDNTSIR